MIAALPMYDLPEARAETDALWALLHQHFQRAGLADVPGTLTRTADVTDTWSRPDLLFTQTCGYPLTHDWADQLRLLATPCYSVEGCDGASYCSVFLVSAMSTASALADLRGSHVAFNATHSQSGYNVLRSAIAPFARDGKFFSQSTQSGGRRQSMALVRNGAADLCAVDCVTWAIHQRYAPEFAEGLRVLGWSEAAPALPYVTAIGRDDETARRLADGLRGVIEDDRGRDVRAALFLNDIEALVLEAYDVINVMEKNALERGYATLC